MKEAIEKAIEGGYKLNPEHVSGWMEPYDYSEAIFLDPLFWQALGKVLGWDEGKLDDIEYGEGKYSQDWMWRHQWHRFIDHLASGKDADSFFKQLLSK